VSRCQARVYAAFECLIHAITHISKVSIRVHEGACSTRVPLPSPGLSFIEMPQAQRHLNRVYTMKARNLHDCIVPKLGARVPDHKRQWRRQASSTECTE